MNVSHAATDLPIDWVTVYVGAGSNIGWRQGHIKTAWEMLCGLPDIRGVATAALMETEAMGPPQPAFLNTVFHLQTRLSPRTLLATCQWVEWQCGRRGWQYPIAWTPRPLDLDILLYADWHIDDDDLVVPHPGIADREFVRQPLEALGVELLSPALT